MLGGVLYSFVRREERTPDGPCLINVTWRGVEGPQTAEGF